MKSKLRIKQQVRNYKKVNIWRMSPVSFVVIWLIRSETVKYQEALGVTKRVEIVIAKLLFFIRAHFYFIYFFFALFLFLKYLCTNLHMFEILFYEYFILRSRFVFAYTRHLHSRFFFSFFFCYFSFAVYFTGNRLLPLDFSLFSFKHYQNLSFTWFAILILLLYIFFIWYFPCFPCF